LTEVLIALGTVTFVMLSLKKLVPFAEAADVVPACGLKFLDLKVI
jgi:hypothetical protein